MRSPCLRWVVAAVFVVPVRVAEGMAWGQTPRYCNVPAAIVYGAQMSGIGMGGLLAGRLSGPVGLVGGGFGIEASVVACAAAGLGMPALVWRRGRVMAPAWRRARPVPATGRWQAHPGGR